MSSLFKGLSDVVGPQIVAPAQTIFAKHSYERVVVGHVLDVILDNTSPFFNTEYGIGAIRFRVTYDDYRKPEEELSLYAVPADRTNYKVPLPGEQVLIYPQIVNKRLFYAYGQIISQDHNHAFNSQPFLGTTPENYDNTTLNVFVNEDKLAKRFEEKLTIPLEVYQNAAYNMRAPREGDTIIEGRFGGLIQMTSTLEKKIVTAQSDQMTIGNDELVNSFGTGDGDPLMIIQANRYNTAGYENIINKVSIDDDDSSVYLTSTQEIPMRLDGSTRMYSWNPIVQTGGAAIKQTADDRAQLILDDGRYDPSAQFVINLNISVNGLSGLNGMNFGAPGGDGSTGVQMGLTAHYALAYDLIIGCEGMIEQAMWDINGWRIGHGSGTFTFPTYTDYTVKPQAGVHYVNLPGIDRHTESKTSNTAMTKWPYRYNEQTKQLEFQDIGNAVPTQGRFLSKYGGYHWQPIKDGKLTPVWSITLFQAHLDLARRIVWDFMPGALQGVPNPDSVPAGIKAALCDAAYQYGAAGVGPDTLRSVIRANQTDIAAMKQAAAEACLNILSQTSGVERCKKRAYVCLNEVMPGGVPPGADGTYGGGN